MAGSISLLETAILDLAATHASLTKKGPADPFGPGQARGIARVDQFYQLLQNVPTPFLLLVMEDIVFEGTPNAEIGGAWQIGEMKWATYVGAESFGSSGEGRVAAYDLIDELVALMEGAPVSDGSQSSRLFFTGGEMWDMRTNAVIYRLGWRHQWIRRKA